MNPDEFEDRLQALWPRLHRYCSRMTGSAINGEDVLQDTLVKALHARAQGAGVDNLEGWLFRIAHNASLDFLRDRSRNTVVPLTEDVEAAPIPEAQIVAIGFRTFLRLPEPRAQGMPVSPVGLLEIRAIVNRPGQKSDAGVAGRDLMAAAGEAFGGRSADPGRSCKDEDE